MRLSSQYSVSRGVNLSTNIDLLSPGGYASLGRLQSAEPDSSDCSRPGGRRAGLRRVYALVALHDFPVGAIADQRRPLAGGAGQDRRAGGAAR